MAIYDCFQFFNEEHILDLRLNILDEHVNFFVIVGLLKSKIFIFDCFSYVSISQFL